MRTLVHQKVNRMKARVIRWAVSGAQSHAKASTEPLLTLQRTVGNRATGQLIKLYRDGTT